MRKLDLNVVPEDFTEFIPSGKRTGYSQTPTYPTSGATVTVRWDQRRIQVSLGYIHVQELYSRIQDMFDEPHALEYPMPISAITPTQYTLCDAWDFDELSKELIYGGSWNYDYKNEYYINIYGLGSISKPEFVKFGYKTTIMNKWKKLGNGKDGHIFDEAIKIHGTDRITVGAFDSNNRILDGYKFEVNGPGRYPVPFSVQEMNTIATVKHALRKIKR